VRAVIAWTGCRTPRELLSNGGYLTGGRLNVAVTRPGRILSLTVSLQAPG
jgi:hypothetical protein